MGLGTGISLSFAESGIEKQTFSPDQISNLASWLMGSEGKTINTVDGVDQVSQWNDKVSGKIWVQPTSANQPLNGSNFVDFENRNYLHRKDSDWDSSSDGFSYENVKMAFITHNTSGTAGHVFSYVMEIERDRGGSTSGFYKLHDNNYYPDTTPGAPYGTQVTTGGGVAMYLDGDFFYQSGSTVTVTSRNATTSAGAEMDYNTKLILTFRYSGGTSGNVKYYRDGNELPMTHGAVATLGEGTAVKFGSSTSNSGFTGKLYETVVYSSDMSDANLALLHNHFKSKYGIS